MKEGNILKKIKDIEIKEIMEYEGRNTLYEMKTKYPKRYEIIRLGSICFKEKIRESELMEMISQKKENDNKY